MGFRFAHGQKIAKVKLSPELKQEIFETFRMTRGCSIKSSAKVIFKNVFRPLCGTGVQDKLIVFTVILCGLKYQPENSWMCFTDNSSTRSFFVKSLVNICPSTIMW